MLRFSAVTLFPKMFESITEEGVIARAIKNNNIAIETIFLRDFADNSRKNVDDKPYGGGDGMLIRADITAKAIESVKTERSFVIHFTPAGKKFSHHIAKELGEQEHLILLCGRYAGFDNRVIEKYADLSLSIGDFVLSGGELPAMCLIDAVTRFLPNVLGNTESAHADSFEDGLLEAPQYTQPREWCDLKVPEVLLSGNHQKISEFRKQEQLRVTAKNRPDLLKKDYVYDELSKQNI